jgi:hypothetical protein
LYWQGDEILVILVQGVSNMTIKADGRGDQREDSISWLVRHKKRFRHTRVAWNLRLALLFGAD